MTIPQPIQYQGSKRSLAPLILQYLPMSTTRLVEELEIGLVARACKGNSRSEEALINF
jgi:hypothetical protein